VANKLTLKAFAIENGWSPSYVTKLKQAGRLVIVDKLVDVKKSLALITQTEGGRSDVKERHAQNRSAGVSELPSLSDARNTKTMAESRRAAALADMEEMNRDKLAGDLIPREEVDAAMKFIGAAIRGLMDVFPDQTAPLVAPVIELESCHSILHDQCRNVLFELGELIEKQRAAVMKGQNNAA